MSSFRLRGNEIIVRQEASCRIIDAEIRLSRTTVGYAALLQVAKNGGIKIGAKKFKGKKMAGERVVSNRHSV